MKNERRYWGWIIVTAHNQKEAIKQVTDQKKRFWADIPINVIVTKIKRGKKIEYLGWSYTLDGYVEVLRDAKSGN